MNRVLLWEETLSQEAPYEYEKTFPLTEEEREEYKLLLLGTLEMDDVILQDMQERGSLDKFLLRYSPEELLFGITLFYRDLEKLRGAYFNGRDRMDFYTYMVAFARWVSKYRLDDFSYWVGKSPHYEEYLEDFKAYWWASEYRVALGSLPAELRDLLEPVARKIADFRSYRESLWLRRDLQRWEKEVLVASAYADYQKEIGEMLLERGFPPNWASPAGFLPSLKEEYLKRG